MKNCGSLAEVLANAFHEREQHMMTRPQITQSFQHQIDKLQTTVEELKRAKVP